MTVSSLPWYATVGVDAALRTGLSALAAIVIGVIEPIATFEIIDCGQNHPQGCVTILSCACDECGRRWES